MNPIKLGVLLSIFCIFAFAQGVHAAATYDFDVPSEYTSSNDSSLEVASGDARLRAFSEFQVNDEIESYQASPQAIELSNGNIFVMWQSLDTSHAGTDNSSYHIAAKVIESDGTVVTSEFQVNDEIESDQTRTQAVALSDGNIFVTWESRDTNHTGTDNSSSHIAAKVITP